eukprot:2372566-Pyramimonas_sp.AAC.1
MKVTEDWPREWLVARAVGGRCGPRGARRGGVRARSPDRRKVRATLAQRLASPKEGGPSPGCLDPLHLQKLSTCMFMHISSDLKPNPPPCTGCDYRASRKFWGVARSLLWSDYYALARLLAGRRTVRMQK